MQISPSPSLITALSQAPAKATIAPPPAVKGKPSAATATVPAATQNNSPAPASPAKARSAALGRHIDIRV